MTMSFSRDVSCVGLHGDWRRGVDNRLAATLMILFVCSVSAGSSKQQDDRVKDKNCYRPYPLPFIREEDTRTVTILLVTLFPSLFFLVMDIIACRYLAVRHHRRHHRSSIKHVSFSKTRHHTDETPMSDVSSSSQLPPVMVEYIPPPDMMDESSIASSTMEDQTSVMDSSFVVDVSRQHSLASSQSEGPTIY